VIFWWICLWFSTNVFVSLIVFHKTLLKRKIKSKAPAFKRFGGKYAN
jgi:hypothetical protein